MIPLNRRDVQGADHHEVAALRAQLAEVEAERDEMTDRLAHAYVQANQIASLAEALMTHLIGLGQGTPPEQQP